MLKTLHQRLILSHILPLLLIVPIVGIALIYSLESGVLLPAMAGQLTSQAQLVAELAGDRPDLWHNQAQAQAFVYKVNNLSAAQVRLFDAEGRLLASSDPTDTIHLNKLIDPPALTDALAGRANTQTNYSPGLHTELVDVWQPVLAADGQVKGVVRLSHQLLTLREQFGQLRLWIVSLLLGGLLLGTPVALMLAAELEYPLQGSNPRSARPARRSESQAGRPEQELRELRL